MKYIINYNKRVFRARSNANSGEVSEQTTFHYSQKGAILSANYSGGKIVKGQMLGVVSPNGEIRFNYHHINMDGQLRSGYCESVPEIVEDGAIILHESWQWMDRDREKGTSILEEDLNHRKS